LPQTEKKAPVASRGGGCVKRQGKSKPKKPARASPPAESGIETYLRARGFRVAAFIKGTPIYLKIDEVLCEAIYRDAFDKLVKGRFPKTDLEQILCRFGPEGLLMCDSPKPDTHSTPIGPLSTLNGRERASAVRMARKLAVLFFSAREYRLAGEQTAIADAISSPIEKAPTLANEDIFCLNFLRLVTKFTGDQNYSCVSRLITAIGFAMEKKGTLSADSRIDKVGDEERLKKLWQRNSALPSRFGDS
jgi:hypothetical protein